MPKRIYNPKRDKPPTKKNTPPKPVKKNTPKKNTPSTKKVVHNHEEQ